MKKRSPILLAIWLALSLSGCSSFRGATGTTPLRVLTFNIHHGEGLDGKVDVERIAKLILESKADLVALQEVDRGVERTKKIDIMTTLADLTGMTYAFGKNVEYQGGEYGNGMLVRFPILEERNHHYQMVRPGEQRGLLQLVLEVKGEEILFINTHLDHRQGDTDRVSGAGEIRDVIKRFTPRPIILCGDFNDTSGSRTISLLKDDFVDAWELTGTGRGMTWPADTPRQRIDYVFISKGEAASSVRLTPLSARVLNSNASDHLPLLVELELKTGKEKGSR